MSKEKAYVGKASRTTSIQDTNRSGRAAEGDNVLQNRSGRGTRAASDGNEAAKRGGHPEILPGLLGKQLRAAYSELLNAPIPDRISELIKQLEQQEAGQTAPQAVRSKEASK